MKKFLEFMKNDLAYLDEIKFSSLKKDETAIIIIDMIKGFYNVGPLANAKVAKIIPNIVRLDENTDDYLKVFFIDNHEEISKEFSSYPIHCVAGTNEAELVDELLNRTNMKDRNTIMIKKNSINGFHCDEIKMVMDNSKIKNYVVVGVCTDICVKNFVMSAITYFNQNNLNKEIIIPANMVETYDAPFHNREFWNLTSLFEMKSNGVKIVKDIL